MSRAMRAAPEDGSITDNAPLFRRKKVVSETKWVLCREKGLKRTVAKRDAVRRAARADVASFGGKSLAEEASVSDHEVMTADIAGAESNNKFSCSGGK